MYSSNPVVLKNKYELAVCLSEAMKGNHRAKASLKEALSTSDMPELFRQVTDYAMKQQYARLQPVWNQFSSRYTVSDFRPQRFLEWNVNTNSMVASNGGADRQHTMALPRVPELTEYPTFSLEAEEELFAVNKYGGRYPFSFEVFLNDEFQVIQDLPGEMGAMARDTEDILTTSVLATETGPNPDFFNDSWDFGDLADGSNIMAGNPALTIDAVETAIQEIQSRYVKNRPVTVDQWALVVPPSLEITANNIAGIANYLRVETDADGIERRFDVPNPVRGRFVVVVNHWLPLLDKSENASTTWYLVPSGGSNGSRRSIITNFLAGHENPELRINGDTGRYVGGGEVPSTEGSFSHDSVEYRVRHVTGAVGVDPSPTMVSLGTGSS